MNSGLFSLPPAATLGETVALRDRTAPHPSAFVAGQENALVRALDQAARDEIVAYNPAVLYGPAGSGKSSLAHALAAIRQQHFQLENVIETAADELAHALAHAVDTASVADFRARYHRCDLLLIDDLQRLKAKPAAQQFLLTVLDALLHRGSWVLVTLPQPPAATPGLAPQLISRLMSGLVARVAFPGPQARREIVRQQADRIGLRLADEQIELVAQCAKGSDCHFLSASRLRQAVLELAVDNELRPGSRRNGRADNKSSDVAIVSRRVTATVARHFGLTAGELKSKSRRQALADARSLAMFVTRRLTGASYAEIGRQFGNRDHTTVLHACRKLAKASEQDNYARQLADDLTAQVASEGVS